MDPYSYVATSLEWWHQYAMLVVLFVALHWMMIRRWVVGIYDPMFVLLMANALGWAIVWFMYLQGDIAAVYAASFTVAQLAFYAGIATGRLPAAQVEPLRAADRDGASVPKLTLTMAAAVHIASTLTIWSLAGIPLFRPSRLGAFEGSGGYGILERLAESSGLIATFSVVYLFVHYRQLRSSFLIGGFLLWYLATIALSGSKGALLIVGQYVLSILFVYTDLRRRRDRFWGGRIGKLLIVLSTVFAIGVLLAQQEEQDLTAAVLAFAFRVISYGDVYIFAYPDATIEAIKGDNPLIGLFGGFLSTFRLLPQDLLYPSMGIQLTRIVFPDLDLTVGPNPQHPVFGYHYFGWFAFVFSFVLGLVTASVQRRFFHREHGTFLGGLAAAVFYFVMISISVDFEYTLSKLASVVIGMVVICLPVLLLCPRAPIVRLPRHRRSAFAKGAVRAE